jgi:hypothetical protein
MGTGGAVGLRAIGWWFVYGGPLLCPAHRPDPIACTQVREQTGCQLCAADQEAERWQALIVAEVGDFPEKIGGAV